MATQSLYRRYRPRRFGEVKGQEHVVRALRNAVIHGREGQAYLFSGPRGTGKTTSARILAKVLNCERAIDGEPCCECESCLAVERGTSYDVHELDAASNNGVDAMRDLIEKASLGTPGRHKVYILDEVHMLSKQAEAALLKTLEEPPAHVVFVLATTDPQKVSDTIRSRTQHLRFHLLPIDELEAHIRWVIADAGLEVSDAALQAVLEQGGGSARDTLSALEVVASSGEGEIDVIDLGEVIEALIESDPGRALTAVAFAVQQGRDPRALADDIVRSLRDCFLSLMAPELVALPEHKASTVAAQATRLGAAKAVRAMEQLGEMLVEMRHAPDARLLLEVALVQLTHAPLTADIGVLVERIEQLERAVANGAVTGALARPNPVDPATGRAQLGGRARRSASESGGAGSAATSPSGSLASSASASSSSAPSADVPAPVAPVSPIETPADSSVPSVPTAATGPSPATATSEASTAASTGGSSGADAVQRAADTWATQIVPSFKPFVRAIYSVARVLGPRDGALVLGMPNEAQRSKCDQHRVEVERAVAAIVGAPVPLKLVVDASATAHDEGHPSTSNVVPLRAASPPPDEDVDLSDLVDAPPETVLSPVERLAQAFPGSKLLDERS